MDRLRQRADFLAVANGARINAAAFVVQSRGRDDNGPVRIGFTVTRKNGTATERNQQYVYVLDDYVLLVAGARRGAATSAVPWSVAQPGSASVWGTGGRGFKSRRSDHDWLNELWDQSRNSPRKCPQRVRTE